MEEQSYYETLEKQNLILYSVIAGSHAHGTNTPASDIDRKFVYCAPLEDIFVGNFPTQLKLNKDHTGYEIGEFLNFLKDNNPTVMEMIFQDEDTIEYIHPLFYDLIIVNRDKFLSKQTRFSFGKYAETQIKKARGGNKKMVKPFPKKKKTPLDFCYVAQGNGSVPIKKVIGEYQKFYGLTRIDHMENCYHVFRDPEFEKNLNLVELGRKMKFLHGHQKEYKTRTSTHINSLPPMFKGIVKKETSQDIALSSIPKGLKSCYVMHYNAAAYSEWCKLHKEYWEWVENRNPERYKDNMMNGNGYDVKNCMHCIRLLKTAVEIFTENTINVKRSKDAEFLLSIRHGKRTFEEVMKIADDLICELEIAYRKSNLPEKVDAKFVASLLLYFRTNLLLWEKYF